MKPYRFVMAVVLGVVVVAGATAGALPVIRHERLHAPRVIAGADTLEKTDGMPENCGRCPSAAPATSTVP